MAILHFKGKSAVWNHHLSVPYQTLDPVADKSLKGKCEEENIIIEGDNLVALKSLLPKYQGKVKCIYIDPPYNTGNESWVYNDNVNNPLIKEWIGKVVGKEGEDFTRHDKWLCMMVPRLKLLRELLTDDGVIFVSIDDNEVHHLRMLMEEVFDEANVEQMIWKKVENDSGKLKITYRFRIEHEYVLVGYKDKEKTRFKKYLRSRNYKNNYTNPDNDPRGEYKQGIISNTEDKSRVGGKNYYSVTTPSGKIFTRQWRVTEDEFNALVVDNRIYFGKKGDSVPSLKVFIGEMGETTPMSVLEGFGTAKTAGADLEDLFDGDRLFSYPKPVSLIKNLINISTQDNDIILDSFAGSGTTAQAVLEMNKEDGGNRKFILVQIPEDTPKDSPAYQAGYKSVQEITEARVKKFIEREKLDAGFTYYKLGKRIDAEGILSGDLPTYNEFARYVYYLATGKNLADKAKLRGKHFLVGHAGEEAIFLIYEEAFENLKNMALTLDIAKKIHEDQPGRKIVYAPACFLDDDHLEQFKITFVGIPFNLFERK